MGKVIEISDYKVMESPAGFYVGRSCLTAYGGDIIPEPYDRASEYFETYEAAESYLGYLCPEDEVSESQEWEDYDPDC